MNLQSVTCYAVGIPAKDGSYAMSRDRVLRSFPSTVVRVTAEDGTAGFGEACSLGANYLDGFPGSIQATIRELAPFVLGCDPLEPNVLVDGMDALVIGHLPGKAAIDAAMWDLRGKLLNLPVARLLGGARQQSFGAFQAISLGAPAAMAAEVTRMADAGFRRWQLKLGGDPLVAAQRVHAAAAVLPAGSDLLTSDANQGWTVAELVRVRAHCALPLMMDEGVTSLADILDALALGGIDALNLKPTRVGGLTKAARPPSTQVTFSAPGALPARTCPSPTANPGRQGPGRTSTTAPCTGPIPPGSASTSISTPWGRRSSSWPDDCP